MRTKNYQYILAIGLVLVTLLFFFTSPYWIHEEQPDRTANYDDAFEFWRWTLKVNNAVYDPGTNSMSFDLYMLWTEEGTPVPPTLTIYNGKANTAKTPLKYLRMIDAEYDPSVIPKYQELDNLKAYKYIYTVVNVPSDYWYITLEFTHTTTSIVEVTKTTDAFGQVLNTEPVIEEKTFNKKVQIDHRIALKTAEVSTNG